LTRHNDDLHTISNMASYPTKLAEAFASKALEIYYQTSVSEAITNQDYEGEIRDKSSILNILTFAKILSHDYTGANMVADDLTESSGQLKTDQAKDFYFRVKSYDKFRSFIKSPEGTILSQTGLELKKVVDTFVLGLYGKAAAGNRIGTDYITGTVAVDASGNVTGSGTTFTAAMVGRPFKALGHTAWYRVKTYSSATAIIIEDDLDDVASQYTGAVIGAGATFNIQAATPIQVTKSTVYDQMASLGVLLDSQEVPEDNRWLVLPPGLVKLVREAPEFIPSGVPSSYEKLVLDGKFMNARIGGQMAGFDVFKSARVSGDGVNGWHVMAGHKSAITYAMGFVETGMEDLIGNFGKAYKSLNVYGAKVVDERRKALTELFAKL
jgi:hypothetical protein